MNRKKIITISIWAGVILILAWWFFLRKKDKPVTIETAQPETGYISESVTATGKIQPVDTVSVGTQVSGTIAKLFADFNSTVKKGQLLAELDKTLLQAQVDQIRSNLAQAQSNQTYQAANYSRQKQLYDAGSISRAEYDIALNTYNSAKANVNAVKAQLRSAQRNLSFAEIYSPIDGVVLNRNVSIGQTVAASFSTPTLFVIAKDITKMQVQANVDEADIGDVKEGLRASFTVDAFLDDEFSGNVREIRLHPSVSSNVVTYTTLIDARNDDKKLKPGMTANITIFTKEAENAMIIPVTAIKFRPDSALTKEGYTLVPDTSGRKRGVGGKDATRARRGTMNARGDRTASASRRGTAGKEGGAAGGDKEHADRASVWVLQDKKLVQKRITTGLNDNTRVEVLSGLSANDNVVTAVNMPQQKGQQSTGSSPFMPQRRGGGGRGR